MFNALHNCSLMFYTLAKQKLPVEFYLDGKPPSIVYHVRKCNSGSYERDVEFFENVQKNVIEILYK